MVDYIERYSIFAETKKAMAMNTTKKTNNSIKNGSTKKKTPFSLYWEKMGNKTIPIYDLKAVLK